jgi:hypothetical protein
MLEEIRESGFGSWHEADFFEGDWGKERMLISGSRHSPQRMVAAGVEAKSRPSLPGLFA